MKIATLEKIHELLKREVEETDGAADYALKQKRERYKELGDLVNSDWDIDKEDKEYQKWNKRFNEAIKKHTEAEEALKDFENTDF